MAQILVTGGAGFIGSHLVDALADRGDHVVVVDALFPQVHQGPPSYLNPKARYLFKDLRDPDILPDALRDVTIVFHLAASVGVGQSMYEIEDYVDANTRGTARFLERIVRATPRIEKLVVASSMSIYGEGAYQCTRCGPVAPLPRSTGQLQQGHWEQRCPRCSSEVSPLPTPESKSLEPASVYAITKRDQEELSLVVGRAFGIPTVACRFFNVYGTRQALSNPYTGVCAIFQSRLQNGQPPIVFEDGRQTRDFVSVKDIVKGLVLAGSQSGADGRAVNLGTGNPTSILEVASTLARLNGRSITPRVTGEYRAGDIRHCTADIRLAQALLGFQPSISFEEGIKEFVQWSRGQTAEDRSEEAYRELSNYGLVGKTSR
jgi:dTDP-L-rhamnose 4-epimerase